MARFIPVNGSMSDKEEELAILGKALHGKYVSFVDLPDGKKLMSQLDVTVINPVASELVGMIIYGDAILYNADELKFTKAV
jgi:hypothetical protein